MYEEEKQEWIDKVLDTFVDVPLTREQMQKIKEIEEEWIRRMGQLSRRSDGINGG